ncbi:type VI secretion system Vgr family protein [Roseomonas rosulenta]|uniref:type VI secretion system Vgr family protein n=1 Tax=Roseomonas rosulenta TaxID=2748667 RepID=UPI0018DF2587|nr:contractile injection system protein, VgrG/Pvc8 family [Roseomonas rosulenta]
MALKQKNRSLLIDTVLANPEGEDEDDNFVLIQVRGAEGISFPYAFDLALIGPKDKRPDPSTMIGSRVRVGIKRAINEENQDEFDHVFRHGVIESFAETGPMDDFRSYSARLVPAFKLTAYETRFRVFEDRTLEQVLREVLRPYPEIELNTRLAAEEVAELIPYCVQFGESTFNFIHRLLDRFGLFYRFEHELNAKNEVLVLGGRNAPRAAVADVVDLGSGEPSAGVVAGFRRTFALATRKAKVGNFNEINPATPFRGEAGIAPDYDLMGEHPALEGEAFPVPATVSPQPRDHAQRRMRQNEGGIFGITGQSKNPLFRAGRSFVVHTDGTVPKDAADKADGKTFLLKTVTIFAYDHSALVSVGDQLFDIVKGLIGLGNKDDVATAAAQGLLDQVKKDVDSGKEIFAWLDKEPGAKNPSGLPDFIGKALGTGGSALAGAVPLLVSTVKSVKDLVEKFLQIPAGLSIAFDALPLDAPFLRDVLPTPSANRPVAYGPHLAMVVGPDGIDTAQRDIFVDALGRVRIRFPWDPGPDDPNDPIGKEALQTGRNTCFVRVSDGWAGERLGTQFLPRIGQEVVVGFIDGDPERPMVVGRAYNARGGSSHLPFLPAGAQGRPLAKPDDLKGSETDQATRSGIRTKTTPRKPEGQSGFHMMRLDDKQGEEQFLLRSERRMDITAFGSRYDTTRGNLHVLVGGSSQEPGKPPPGGSIFTTAGGEFDLHVGKDLFANIDSAINFTVKADEIRDIGGTWSMYATGNAVISADEIILQAKKKITIKVGASSVVVTPSSITNDAAIYKEQQGGSPSDAPVVELTDAADAAMADPGEPPDFLARQPKGGGGPRRKHSKGPKNAAFVTRADDGTLQVGGNQEGKSGLRIKTEDPDFADKVIDDLSKINETPEGRQKIADAINSDKPTVIEPPETPTDPPSASSKADNPVDATAPGFPTGQKGPDGKPVPGTGKGSGTTITYDPEDWPREGDPDSPTSDAQLNDLLDDAQRNRDGRAGTVKGDTSPNPLPPPPPPPLPPPRGGD